MSFNTSESRDVNVRESKQAISAEMILNWLAPLSQGQLVQMLSYLGTKYPVVGEEIRDAVRHDPHWRKLFVRQLSFETTTETLERVFSEFGDISEAAVIYDKISKRSKGFGFVTFADPEAAERALQIPHKLIDGRLTECCLAAAGKERELRSVVPTRDQMEVFRSPPYPPVINQLSQLSMPPQISPMYQINPPNQLHRPSFPVGMVHMRQSSSPQFSHISPQFNVPTSASHFPQTNQDTAYVYEVPPCSFGNHEQINWTRKNSNSETESSPSSSLPRSIGNDLLDRQSSLRSVSSSVMEQDFLCISSVDFVFNIVDQRDISSRLHMDPVGIDNTPVSKVASAMKY